VFGGVVVVGGHDVYFVFDRVQAVQRSERFGAVGVEETAWASGSWPGECSLERRTTHPRKK